MLKRLLTLCAVAVMTLCSYAEKVDLTADMFCEWDNYEAGANVVKTNVGDFAIGTSSGLPYGTGSVLGNCYADLSAYEALVLTVTEGAPRLLLNRPAMGDSGQPDYIEIKSADSPYAEVDGEIWTIKLADIVAEHGYAHLNAIKGANWANVTITSAVLVTAEPAVPTKPVPAFSELEADGETIYYLYNVDAGAFFMSANEWSTRASVSESYGFQFKIEENNGKYILHDDVQAIEGAQGERRLGWKVVFAESATSIYVDRGSQPNWDNWTITALGNNTYTIGNEAVAGLFGINADQDVAKDSRLYFVEEGATTWAFVSEEGYAKYLEDAAAYLAYLKSETAKPYIYAMAAELEATNVYTAEAKAAFEEKYPVSAWLEGVENGTLTGDEADAAIKAYKANFSVTGWHAANDIDDLLTSAWDGADGNFGGKYYINTWSVEGESDGSEFKVPFFEYWTGDGESLGATTMTATVSGLVPGAIYSVSSWTRTRIKNGAEAPTYGISFKVGDTEVNACGEEAFGPMYIANVTASGKADAEGNLTISYIVAEDNNVSWLSWKNVYYEFVELPSTPGAAADEAIALVEGWNEALPVENVYKDEAGATWFSYTAEQDGVFYFACQPAGCTLPEDTELEVVENYIGKGTAYGKVVKAGETVTFAVILPTTYVGVEDEQVYDITEYYIEAGVIAPEFAEIAITLNYNDENTMCTVIPAPGDGKQYYSLDGGEELQAVEGAILLAYTGTEDTFTYNVTVIEFAIVGEDEDGNAIVDFEQILAKGFEQVILARPIDIAPAPGDAADNAIALAEGWIKVNRDELGMDEANYTHFTYTAESEGIFAFACMPGNIVLDAEAGMEEVEIIGVRGKAYGKAVKAGDVVTFKAILPAVYTGVEEDDDNLYDITEYYIYTTILAPDYLLSGDYFVVNAETGQFLGGANSWGTQASLVKSGQLMTLTRNDEGKYSIDTHISNGGASHFLGTNGYVDAAEAYYTLEEVEDAEAAEMFQKVYAIKNDEGKYLAADENDVLNWSAETVEDAAKWIFATEDVVLESTVGASPEEEVDLTALIKDANFGRNNQYFSAWEVLEGTAPGKGGDNANFNAEKWGGNSQEFNVAQTITGLPNGLYHVNVQGFYRWNNTEDNTNQIAIDAHADGTEVINSYFYANDVVVPFKSIADEESLELYGEDAPFSQVAAGVAFAAGAYENELIVLVTDGTLTIGVKKVQHDGCDWTVWDNFRLSYMGAPVALEEGLNKFGEIGYENAPTYFAYTAREDGRVCVTTYGPEFENIEYSAEGAWIAAENPDDVCIESYVIPVKAGETVVFRADVGAADHLGYTMLGVHEEDADGNNHVHANVTAIDSVSAAAKAGVIYNVAGQRLSKMQKGINIVGGKKVLK